MKIKRYIQFIKESSSEDFHSLGEWVESLIDDDYVKNIVSRYTQDISPDVDLSNAINVLDEKTQNDIRQQLERYTKNGIEEKDPIMIASTETEQLMESEVTTAGKGIFSSFMKTLTALGLKDSKPNWEKCPEDYLIFYYYQDLDAQSVKQVFERFKSLVRYSGMIDYGKNEVSLYYGIKCDGTFEYGVHYDSLNKMGQFRLSQSVVKWIVSMDLSSAASLKKELVNLTYSDIITLGKVKADMTTFSPGYFEKKSFPIIKDRVISFGYYGVGKWDNGKLDEGEFMNTKNKFTTWLLSKRWSGKVLINVQPSSFWLFIHIKLK